MERFQQKYCCNLPNQLFENCRILCQTLGLYLRADFNGVCGFMQRLGPTVPIVYLQDRRNTCSIFIANCLLTATRNSSVSANEFSRALFPGSDVDLAPCQVKERSLQYYLLTFEFTNVLYVLMYFLRQCDHSFLIRRS